MRHRSLIAGFALLHLLTGCAAMLRGPAVPLASDGPASAPASAEPIGALQAHSPALTGADATLRAGLQAQASQLLAHRAPTEAGKAAAPAKPSVAGPKVAEPKAGELSRPSREDTVAAMLAKARQGAAAAPAKPRPPTMAAAPAPALSPLLAVASVKVQTRQAETLTAAQDGLTLIRFAAGEARLDNEGNRQLAELAGRTGLEPNVRLVVTAGLAGQGEPWQRLQLASRRAESVALHVPPPLVPDRRFDPALDVNTVQVRISRGPL